MIPIYCISLQRERERRYIPLNEKQFKSIKLRLNDRKFLYFKINGEYKKCFQTISEKKYFRLSLKNLFILLTPNFLLKRLLRF